MVEEYLDFISYGYHLIDNKKLWQKALELIHLESKIGIDIEADNKCTLPKICLIQISIRGFDFIIDPLANFDFEELGEILQNRDFLKIFHGSDYDLRLLWNQYNWRVNNIFDTMWAAKILGEKEVGLVPTLYKFLNVSHDKKYQCSNWKKRPLSRKQLEYARRDSHYLISLAERFENLLIQKKLFEEAKEYFEELSLEAVLMSDNNFFKEVVSFQKLPQPNYLVFKDLHELREKIALSIGLLPTQILSNRCLFQIAIELPLTEIQLEIIKDIERALKYLSKKQIIEVVQSAIAAPGNPSYNNDEEIHKIKKRAYRLTELRKRIAQQNNVESELIMTKNKIYLLSIYAPQSLEELAKLNLFGPIRFKKYAPAIIEAITNSEEDNLASISVEDS